MNPTVWMSRWEREIRKLKDTNILLFRDNFESGLFRMKLCHLEHECIDLEKVGSRDV